MCITFHIVERRFYSSAFHNTGISFLGAEMDHWCQVPQLANLTIDQQRLVGIPTDERGQQNYSQCYMYDTDYRYGLSGSANSTA